MPTVVGPAGPARIEDALSDRVAELLRTGLDHYLNGRLREAAGAWQEVLRLDPENARAREYMKSALSAHQGPPKPGADAAVRQMAPATNAWESQGSRTIVMDDAVSGPAMEPSITSTPPPRGVPPAESRQEVEQLMRGARELYALNDFSGALELLEKVLATTRRADAEQMRDDCVETLIQMFESQLGALTGIPETIVQHDEVIWLNLDHRAGYVLAQIDGEVSYDDLYAISGMSRIDTARILAQLLQEKVIRTRPR